MLVKGATGSDSIQRCSLTIYVEIPIVEMERFYDRLISTMGFPVLVRRHLYLEPGPRIFAATVHSCTVSIYMARIPIQIQIWNSRLVLIYVMDESVTGVHMNASYIWYYSGNTWFCDHWQGRIQDFKSRVGVGVGVGVLCGCGGATASPVLGCVGCGVWGGVGVGCGVCVGWVHFVYITRVCFIINELTTKFSSFCHTCLFIIQEVYQFMWWNMYLLSFQS